MPVPNFGRSAAHTSRSHCRVSFGVKLRFVHQTQRASSQLWVNNAAAEVLSLAVCKLHPARYGTAEDVMTASLTSCTQQVLAVDILELDIKLVTALQGNKLFKLVYKNMSRMA